MDRGIKLGGEKRWLMRLSLGQLLIGLRILILYYTYSTSVHSFFLHLLTAVHNDGGFFDDVGVEVEADEGRAGGFVEGQFGL